ncbi:MAG: hypothetical protein ABIB43_02885 [archaeon]
MTELELKVYINSSKMEFYTDQLAMLELMLDEDDFPKLHIRKEEKQYLKTLPADYDLYIIHLSDVSLDEIKRIREKQPYSKVFGISGSYISGYLCEYDAPRFSLKDICDDGDNYLNFKKVKRLIKDSWVTKTE